MKKTVLKQKSSPAALDVGVNLATQSPYGDASQHLPRGGTDMAAKCPTIYLRTFGCQMNKRDSEIVRGLLEEKGYAFTDSEDNADIIIFNTCSVREHAEHRAMSILGHISRKKRKNRIFGLIGCLAQHKKDALFKSIPNLDFICGPSDIYKIPELIIRSRDKKEKIAEVGKSRESRSLDYINPYYRDSGAHAYVNIMYGCDNFCSYCIVPYVRGREVSRPLEDIITEITEAVKRGIKDITLLGQNVNSYKGTVTENVNEIASLPRNDEVVRSKQRASSLKTCDFTHLLRLINSIKGVKKISFMTSHPKDANIALFKAMKELDKVEKHLHLPLQSGSNRILKLMNRGYTIEKYRNLLDEYRDIMPKGRISTDIIVGFPTETEKDFNETKKAVEKIQFDSAYIFKYSPRPPAKSALLEDDVGIEEKQRRNNLLLILQKDISAKKKDALR